MVLDAEIFQVGIFYVTYFKGNLVFNILPEKQDEINLLTCTNTKYDLTYFIKTYGEDLAQFKMLVFDEMLKESFKIRYNMCLDHTVSVCGDEILKVVNYV